MQPATSIDSNIVEGETIPLTLTGATPNTFFDVYATINGVVIDNACTETDGIWQFSAPDVTEDTTATLHIYAYKNGELRSDVLTRDILIQMMDMTLRTPFAITSFSVLGTNSHFTVDSGDLIADTSDAYAITQVENYDPTIKKMQLNYKVLPSLIEILAGSTNTSLETSQEVIPGETIIVADGTTTAKISAIVESSGSASTIDILDPFGDGSGKECLQFNNSLTGLGGTSTESPWCDYAAGKFGNGISGNETHDHNDPFNLVKSGAFTMSFWFKHTGGASTGQLFIFGDYFVYINIMDGYIKLQVKNTSDNYVTEDTGVYVADGNFHQVVFYTNENRTYFEFLIDNSTSVSYSISAAAKSTSFDLRTENNFQGVLDQLRFFNRKLTRSEQDQIYTESGSNYVVDITSAGLAGTPTFASRDNPTMNLIAGGVEKVPTITSLTENAGLIDIVTAEEVTDSATLEVKILAKNVGDKIESFSCELWE